MVNSTLSLQQATRPAAPYERLDSGETEKQGLYEAKRANKIFLTQRCIRKPNARTVPFFRPVAVWRCLVLAATTTAMDQIGKRLVHLGVLCAIFAARSEATASAGGAAAGSICDSSLSLQENGEKAEEKENERKMGVVLLPLSSARPPARLLA